MPTLEFKGKHIVYVRHLNAPYRLLDVDRKKSPIIHGDNLPI